MTTQPPPTPMLPGAGSNRLRMVPGEHLRMELVSPDERVISRWLAPSLDDWQRMIEDAQTVLDYTRMEGGK